MIISLVSFFPKNIHTLRKQSPSVTKHSLINHIYSSLRDVIKGFLFKKQTPVLKLSPGERLASAKNYFSIVIFHDYPPLILFELLTNRW